MSQEEDERTRVLFVCVHNAARSRMAEAFLRARAGDRFEITSAGFEPHEANSLVVEAMMLAGVPLEDLGTRPSVFQLFRAGARFRYVIAVCDEAHDQRCPVFPGFNTRLSWSFPDPSTFTGTHQERLARVIEVRDAIRQRVDAWVESVGAGGQDG